MTNSIQVPVNEFMALPAEKYAELFGQDFTDSLMSSGKLDPEKIKAGMATLEKASHKLAEEVYKATAGKQQAGAAGGPTAGPETGEKKEGPSAKSDNKDDIIDADFKAEDDDKKKQK